MNWSLPEICGQSLAGNCFVLMYCFLNRGNNPSARKADFLKCDTVVFWEEFWRLLCCWEVLAALLETKKCPFAHSHLPHRCAHMCTHAPSCPTELSSAPAQQISLCLSAPGRLSHSLHVPLPNDGCCFIWFWKAESSPCSSTGSSLLGGSCISWEQSDNLPQMSPASASQVSNSLR